MEQKRFNILKKEYLEVIHYKVNKGYGAALKTGLFNVRTNYAITMDADGQHELKDIIKLFEKFVESDSDMIVGSRKGQKSVN